MADTMTEANVSQNRAQPQQSASQNFGEAINNPDHPIIVDALSRLCDQCGAYIGAECKPRGGLHADLAGRRIHYGRMEKP